MPFRRRKNYQGQANDGEKPPESPDQAVDPQAAPAGDSSAQKRVVLPPPRHRGQINLLPAQGQAEQHDYASPPPAHAQPKHREQINLPPAPPQTEQRDHASPPPAQAQPKH